MSAYRGLMAASAYSMLIASFHTELWLFPMTIGAISVFCLVFYGEEEE